MKLPLLGLVCWVIWNTSLAQFDTLTLTLAEAEQIFLKENYLLLAQQANIKEAKALEIQARLFPNPYITFENQIFNHQSHRFFPTATEYPDGSTGQNTVEVSQLLLLARKRSKQRQLASFNTQLTEWEFYDIVRQLRYELRTSFYHLYYLNRILAIYEEEIREISQTARIQEEHYRKGNLPLNEVVRLKTLLLNLEYERNQRQTQCNDLQSNLRVLLSLSRQVWIHPLFSDTISSKRIQDLVLENCLNDALMFRPDIQQNIALKKYHEQEVVLQKALAYPDLELALTYDRNGNNIPHYFGIRLGLPLPLFHRNQGNIQASKAKSEYADQQRKFAETTAYNDVITAYQKLIRIDKLYVEYVNRLTPDYDKLMDSLIEAYRKKNIDIVEFTNYLDAYRISMIQLIEIQLERMQSIEELNFATAHNQL